MIWNPITKLVAASPKTKHLDRGAPDVVLQLPATTLSAKWPFSHWQSSVKSELIRLLSPLKRKRDLAEAPEPIQKEEESPKGAKRRKIASLSHGSSDPVTEKPPVSPRQHLDILVCGSGECGELGLGYTKVGNKSPAAARSPCLNRSLGADEVGVVQMAVGSRHCAALTHDGRVLTWGVNDTKALGRITRPKSVRGVGNGMNLLHRLESVPLPAQGLSELALDIVQVAATEGATFALTRSGLVYGWGTFLGSDGIHGFLREKTRKKKKRKDVNYEAKLQTTPVLIEGLKKVKELSTGLNHVLALTESGNVYAWGSGQQAQLGRRLVQRHQRESLVPRMVDLPRKGIVKIFAGFNHSFALDTSGRVWTWGLNIFGQTGILAADDNLYIGTPTLVSNLTRYNIRNISAGLHHSMACTEDGRVLVWGRCDEGQTGMDVSAMPEEHFLFDTRGTPRILQQPAVVPGITATFVVAGVDTSVAVSENGRLFAWGLSEDYRTGLGTEDTVYTPTELVGKGFANEGFTWAGCGDSFTVFTRPRNS